MRKITLTFIGIAFLLCSIKLSAQSIVTQTLIWETSEIKNKATGDQFALASQIITTATNIEWIQGGNKKVFVIADTIGTWQDIQQDGQMIFVIKSEFESSITFRRTNGTVSIEFSFKKGGVDAMPVEFAISSVHTKSNP
jgi:hypothetical protein